MKRKRFLQTAFTLTAALLLLAACTQNELSDGQGEPLPEGRYPLTFTATGLQATPQTRATADGSWTTTDPVAIMVGGTVKKYVPTTVSSNTATLEAASDETPFYWQNTSNINVSAWYLGTEYTATLPTTWSVQPDQNSNDGYQKSDFLYAPAKSIAFNPQTGTDNNLTFYHQTAKVIINIRKEGILTDASKITSVVIGNNNNIALKGTYAIPTGNGTAGTWTPATEADGKGTITPKTLTNPNTVSFGSGSTSEAALASYEALVIPQTVTTGTNFICITVDGSTYYYKAEDGKNTLSGGSVHTYNITVKKDKLEVTASSSVLWENDVTTGNAQDATFRINYENGMTLEAVNEGTLQDEDSNTKILSGGNLLKVTLKKQDGKFLKEVLANSIYYTRQSWKSVDNGYEIIYQIKSDVTLTSLFADKPELETGSYYYADGEWSTALWDKPCIGIVFKVGRDENDKNTYENLNNEVQGYVVALQDAPGERNPFGSSADISLFTTSTTDFQGYAACQSMKNQSGFSIETHRACYSALHYTPEAPAASSGWYLPSLGEWNVLWHSMVQEKFATAGGSKMDKNWGFYWSMSKKNEQDSQPAFVDFGYWSSSYNFSNAIRYNDWGEYLPYTRPILTF